MNEADLLNVIYDTKAEVRVLLKKRKYEEAHGNDTSTMLQMGKEIKKANPMVVKNILNLILEKIML